MRRIAAGLVLSAVACASAPPPHREARPDALRGVSILVPATVDERPSMGIGCGFVARDLPLRANKGVVEALGEAGATLRSQGPADYTLTVTLRDAVMGAENEGRRRNDRPVISQQPDAPPIDQPQASPFNSGNDRAQVVLEAALRRGEELVWAGTVTGSARSAPCVRAMDKVREALGDAVATLRDRVISAAGTRGR